MISKAKNKTLLLMMILVMIFSVITVSPKVVKASPSEPSIIPKPLSYTQGTGQFTLTGSTSIYVQGNTTEETDEIYKIGQYLANKLRPSTGFNISVIKSNSPVAGSIYLTTIGGESSQGNEGYKLDTTTDGVTLIAYKPEGLFRGIQTIRQLLPGDIEKSTVVSGVQWVMPCSRIMDKPAYESRGMMLDVARHFFTKQEVERQIDLAAQYKINRFHLHLTDDQGWRIEIKSFPDLTNIGSTTEVDLSASGGPSGGPGPGIGGYYTQDDFKEIISYANARYVEIIPEIDMPSHINAALASIAELNPSGQKAPLYTGVNVGFNSLMCRSEVTYDFVDKVINEVAAMSPSPYIHIGADEAASTSASDYAYFIGRVTDIVKSHGKKLIGWDPYQNSVTSPSDSVLQFWTNSSSVTTAVSKGMKVITSPMYKAYTSRKYDATNTIGRGSAGSFIPSDIAYNWDPSDYAPTAPAGAIAGLECCLWTETFDNQDGIDLLTYPRLPGYAEIGWTPKSMRNWADYKLRLQNQGQRMTNEGIAFYKDPVVWDSSSYVPVNADWNMNEGTGTVIKDSIGNNSGTINGGVTWTTHDKFENALQFNGVNGYVYVGKPDLQGDWTAAMWVKRQASSFNSSALIGGDSSVIKLEQYNNSKKVGISQTSVGDYSFNYTAPIDTWVHLAFVGTSTGTSLYVNGVLIGTIPQKIKCPMKLIGAAYKPDGSGNVISFHKGALDEVKIFNRALSADEIQNLTVPPAPVDNTPPVTSTKVTGDGSNGWYNSNVTVTLTSTDDQSGVDRTEYRIGESGDWITYNGPVVMNQDGVYTLEYRSIDKAGNTEETKQQIIKIDKAMPQFELTMNGSDLKDGESFDDYLPITFKASDDLSGIASAKINIGGQDYIIDTNTQHSIDIDISGKPGSYTALVTLEDVAGNKLETSISFNVTTSISSMTQLVNRYVDSGELSGPIIPQLTNDLKQAQHQLDIERPDNAAKHIQDFADRLNNEALSNCSSEKAKTVLNADAQYIK